MTPGSPIAAGLRWHLVQLACLGDPQPDGDGGFVQPLSPLTPAAVYAEVRPATGREATAHGTSLALADAIVTIPYHAQVTTQTVVTLRTRTFCVVSVQSPDERQRESVLYCRERAV